jgi:ribosomal protein L12E/L44/L45/RPP1/RPP2
MNKEELTAKAEALGVEVDPEWTKAEIHRAMDTALKSASPASAKKVSAPPVEPHSGATRGDGSDAAKPIAAPGHHGVNPGRYADQY